MTAFVADIGIAGDAGLFGVELEFAAAGGAGLIGRSRCCHMILGYDDVVTGDTG